MGYIVRGVMIVMGHYYRGCVWVFLYRRRMKEGKVTSNSHFLHPLTKRGIVNIRRYGFVPYLLYFPI